MRQASRSVTSTTIADADCVHVGWGVDCYNGCGQSTIATSAADATRSLAAQRIALICAELASCQREGAPSCPPFPLSVAACIDGGCQGLILSEMSCEELGNRASLRGISAMENTDGACNVDADCALVGSGVRCFADCGVASSAVQQVQNDVELLESQFCSQFDAAECPAPVIPPSVPPQGVPTPCA